MTSLPRSPILMLAMFLVTLAVPAAAEDEKNSEHHEHRDGKVEGKPEAKPQAKPQAKPEAQPQAKPVVQQPVQPPSHAVGGLPSSPSPLLPSHDAGGGQAVGHSQARQSGERQSGERQSGERQGEERWGEERRERHEHHEFHERNVRFFSPEDLMFWSEGTWVDTCFAGRCGWWWVSGGVWYGYDRPTYPYPQYVAEGIDAPYQPIPAPPPPAQQFWYYCDNPAGYFPYVKSCNQPYRPVPIPPQ